LREDHVAGLELADGPLLARCADPGSQHGHWADLDAADLRRDEGGNANIDILDRDVSNRDIDQPVLHACTARRGWLTSPPLLLVAV